MIITVTTDAENQPELIDRMKKRGMRFSIIVATGTRHHHTYALEVTGPQHMTLGWIREIVSASGGEMFSVDHESIVRALALWENRK